MIQSVSQLERLPLGDVQVEPLPLGLALQVCDGRRQRLHLLPVLRLQPRLQGVDSVLLRLRQGGVCAGTAELLLRLGALPLAVLARHA